jgi:uncharacterized protein YjiK
MKNTLPILFILSFLFISCGEPSGADSTQSNVLMGKVENKEPEPKVISISDSSHISSYNLEEPLLTIPLSLALLEISGLSYYPEMNQLLAVNDERGWIFFLNATTGDVEERKTFSGNGDFEGVEWLGDKISIVKSNGDIYFYEEGKKEPASSVKTKLKPSNNIEGLAFDADNNQLLLACKGDPNLGKSDKYKKTKNIYSFDLGKNELEKDPFLSVEDDVLEDYIKDFAKKNDFSKKKRKKLKKRVNDFSPSGIAIHPKTKDFYMISSQGKLLIIFNKNKELQEVIFLDEKVHRQPEGICFAPNGDLFISNEGKGLGAKIMKYNMMN